MPAIMDRYTITYYGDDEVKTSMKFRELLKHKGRSANDVIKRLIAEYIKKG